jgi:hypothetical protein
LSNGVFAYGNFSDGFYIMASATELVDEIEVELDDAVEGAINQFLQYPKVADFDYKVEEIETNGVSGKIITGSFKESGKLMHIVQYVYVNGHSIQQIAIIHRQDDVYAKEIKARVFKSIQLEKQADDDEEDEEE